jgi:hypothetical protein
MRAEQVTIKEGDRVVATEPIPFLTIRVPRGTKGTVIRVRGVMTLNYIVKFDNGRTEDCTQKEIDRI